MYLDANFFIYANFDVNKKGKVARTILKQIIAGKEAITSSLALDEVMWVLRKNGRSELTRTIVEEVYSIKNFEVKEVSALIPLKALEFMEKYNLKPRDAFHAAVMEEFNEKEIVSDDSDFDKLKKLRRVKLS